MFNKDEWRGSGKSSPTTSGRQMLNHICCAHSIDEIQRKDCLLRQPESYDADSFSLYIVDYSPSMGKLMVWILLRASVANHFTIGHRQTCSVTMIWINMVSSVIWVWLYPSSCHALHPPWACLGILSRHMHTQSLITDVVLNKQLMNVDVPKEYDWSLHLDPRLSIVWTPRPPKIDYVRATLAQHANWAPIFFICMLACKK